MAPRLLPSPPVFDAAHAVLLDVDGTLVDSNDAHARAWIKAFHEQAVGVDGGAVRFAIGMGADKLVPHVSGISLESPEGRQIARRRREIFATEFLPRLKPFRDADRLVRALKRRGLRVVTASSASEEEMKQLITIAGIRGLLDGGTSGDDADESKPAPDIIHAALKRARVAARDAVMIGDTPYDIEASARANVPAIAFRTGGWSDDDLRGAVAIYDGPWHLADELEQLHT